MSFLGDIIRDGRPRPADTLPAVRVMPAALSTPPPPELAVPLTPSGDLAWPRVGERQDPPSAMPGGGMVAMTTPGSATPGGPLLFGSQSQTIAQNPAPAGDLDGPEIDQHRPPLSGDPGGVAAPVSATPGEPALFGSRGPTNVAGPTAAGDPGWPRVDQHRAAPSVEPEEGAVPMTVATTPAGPALSGSRRPMVVEAPSPLLDAMALAEAANLSRPGGAREQAGEASLQQLANPPGSARPSTRAAAGRNERPAAKPFSALVRPDPPAPSPAANPGAAADPALRHDGGRSAESQPSAAAMTVRNAGKNVPGDGPRPNRSWLAVGVDDGRRGGPGMDRTRRVGAAALQPASLDAPEVRGPATPAIGSIRLSAPDRIEPLAPPTAPRAAPKPAPAPPTAPQVHIGRVEVFVTAPPPTAGTRPKTAWSAPDLASRLYLRRL